MTPLRVTARLAGAVALPHGPLALDALLAWAVMVRDAIQPALTPEECVPIEIPVEREPAGRFHLASFAVGQWEARENRWVNRRFPTPEAQMFAEPKFKRIQINAGAQKSYRLPLEAGHFADDVLAWWCVGDPVEIRELLGFVGYLGKRRAVGLGKVRRWDVEPCEPWGDGFPVVREGRALRTLPPDWPGLVAPELRHATLTYPYHHRFREELAAVATW